MLVSIGIILIMVGISLPIMNTMNNWSKVDTGVNTVGVAVQATRAYVDREKTGNSDPFVDPTEDQPAPPFEGIAIVFSPSGEIRVTKFDPGAARNAAGDLLLVNDTTPRAGFSDIPNRDYIDVPSTVEIFGIRRVAAGAGGIELLRPPFAVRFDGNGNLITGRIDAPDTIPAPGGDTIADEDGNLVFYDADFNDIYEVALRTPGNWSTPGQGYDNYRASYAGAGGTWDTDRQAYVFGYEGLETVVGVRVIDPSLYDVTLADPNDNDPDSYRDIFFSRYTGSPMRNQ